MFSPVNMCYFGFSPRKNKTLDYLSANQNTFILVPTIGPPSKKDDMENKDKISVACQYLFGLWCHMALTCHVSI